MQPTIKRFWNIVPYILSLGALLFLAWCTYQSIVYPKDGIVALQTPWIVRQIDPGSPAQNRLFPGDTIISVDEVPVAKAAPFYLHKHAGESVQFVVKRSDQTLVVDLTLAEPSPFEILQRIIPMLVALIFLLLGLGVQLFSQNEGEGLRAFLFFETSSLLIASGAVSYAAPTWAVAFFLILMWLIGPLAVQFHLRFLQIPGLPRQRIGLGLLFLVVGIGIIWNVMIKTMPGKFQFLSTFESLSRLIFLALNLLIVIFLLLYAYQRTTKPGARSRIRLVILGGVLSTLSVFTLTILPAVLGLTPLLPYSFALALLVILPLTYGYAIFRHNLIQVEKHVNRGATYLSVFLILGGCYIIFYALIHRLLPIDAVTEPLVNTFLALCLAMLFTPLQRSMQRLVDTAFYGGWYDYRSAINQITQGLDRIDELRPLAHTLSTRLASVLRLEDACVFLRDDQGIFSVTDVSPQIGMKEIIELQFPALPMSSLKFLLSLGETGGRYSMREALLEVPFTPEELELLNSEQVHLWVPILGHGEVQGYLALGPKFGGDIFSGEDMDILRIVSWQLAPIIENIHLVNRLRQHALDLEQRVTERTAELYEAKERVETILASVGDGVVVFDNERTIRTVNSAFVKQTGFPATELIGRKYDELLSGQNLPSRLEDLAHAMDQKLSWTGDLLQLKKSGGQYEVQLTVAPVVDQEGVVIGYVGSMRDITQQKELERLKDQFISDVSHELRTPVTNLSLYLDLLESAPSDKGREYFSVLRGQCQLLDKLVEDILDLSRLELAKIKRATFLPVDIGQTVDQVVVSLQPLAMTSGLNLTYKTNGSSLWVPGDQNQLTRAISNLVVNAIRYTPEGEVCVSTFHSETDVCIEVRDTGMGIDDEDTPHIFERFYRGRQVRQSKIHGTGLGLAIVKEIVEFHHGKIEVDSMIGKGSIFQIWLPITS